MKSLSFVLSALIAATLMVGTIACGGEEGDDDSISAETDDPLFRGGLGNTGDYCEYPSGIPGGMTLPGRENGSGECCRTTSPTDCVVILKPFPTLHR